MRKIFYLLLAGIAVNASGIDSIQKILRPRHQEPDNGTAFFCNCPQNPLRLNAPQQDSLGAGQQRTEPVHLGAGVV